jgi:hypothetical protein
MVSKDFWDHIHRKYCLVLKEENPSKALPEQDSESLKNQFQLQIPDAKEDECLRQVLQASQGVPPITKIISINTDKSLIMLKLLSIASQQLTVISLPLLALHHMKSY